MTILAIPGRKALLLRRAMGWISGLLVSGRPEDSVLMVSGTTSYLRVSTR